MEFLTPEGDKNLGNGGGTKKRLVDLFTSVGRRVLVPIFWTTLHSFPEPLPPRRRFLNSGSQTPSGGLHSSFWESLDPLLQSPP